MKKIITLLLSMTAAILANAPYVQAQSKPGARKPVTSTTRATSVRQNPTRTPTTPDKKGVSAADYTRSQSAPEPTATAVVQPGRAEPVKMTRVQPTAASRPAVRVTAVRSKASRLQLGFRAGLNSTTIDGINTAAFGTGIQLARVTGFHAGVIFNIGGPTFSVQPELLLSQYGVRLTAGSDYLQLKYNLVEMPVLLKASFGQPNLRFFINVGPVATYTMGGTISVLNAGQADSQKIDLTGTGRLSFGGSGGSGVALKVGPGTAQLEARYTYLFSKDEYGTKLNLQNLMVSAGYLIPLGGR